MSFDTNISMRGGLWFAQIIVKENGKENEIWERGGYTLQSTAKQQLTRMIKEQEQLENDNIKGTNRFLWRNGGNSMSDGLNILVMTSADRLGNIIVKRTFDDRILHIHISQALTSRQYRIARKAQNSV